MSSKKGDGGKGKNTKKGCTECVRLRKEHGHIAGRIGKAAERRVLHAFQPEGTPQWFRYVRAATKDEDKEGSDCFVVTSHGEFPVQIKSSQPSEKESEKYRIKDIPVVVVDMWDSEEKVREKVIKAIRPFVRRARKGARKGT